MPWRETTLPSISPLVKIGRMLSNSLIFCDLDALEHAALGGELRLPALESAMSTVFGWVMKRLIEAEVSRFCIVTLKPRSFDAWSPIALTTE